MKVSSPNENDLKPDDDRRSLRGVGLRRPAGRSRSELVTLSRRGEGREGLGEGTMSEVWSREVELMCDGSGTGVALTSLLSTCPEGYIDTESASTLPKLVARTDSIALERNSSSCHAPSFPALGSLVKDMRRSTVSSRSRMPSGLRGSQRVSLIDRV